MLSKIGTAISTLLFFKKMIHAFFYKQHFYKQRQAEFGKILSKG